MDEEKVGKVIDVRQACCYDTLTTPIKNAIATMKPDEILEVIITESLKRDFNRFVEKEEYKIIEEIKQGEDILFRISLKTKEQREKKMENCMVCGESLEYLTEAASVICNYCGKEESGYIRCPIGHYVCEECHGKGAYDAILDLAFTTTSKDPVAIAEMMMGHPNIPMLGCEHAPLTAAAFMAALKNEGSLGIGEKQIVEAMERAKKQAISGYCGLTGVCGVPIAIGSVFSVILGAECPRDRETSITMHVVARIVDAIANDTGPCCCKSYVRTAMSVGTNLAKEYLNVKLPIHLEKVSCFYIKRHPHGCRAAKCNYFPKRSK